MAQYMLENRLCERAYISDISAASLKKAEQLLCGYIRAGKCIPVVADGLDGIPEPCDLVLIAGMGGEEIVKILSRGVLPARLVLQPMKNSDKVRRFLLGRGAHLEQDFTFSAGSAAKKYYDLIVCRGEGGDRYSEREIAYGRDNLRGTSEAFLEKLKEDRAKLYERLERPLSAASRRAIGGELEQTEEIIREITRIL